ncbi:hypothetical protein CU098_007803 [Rhizopus stolonifer]|uniref:CUE domain-containing protein n=1 Tax=Rhizopus stolonifer TaxID=4846 RepID=A0A367KLE7_RHIST|nr:hypothetical protein CU098_007803 [Rhizopus stolonifer]
MDGEGFRNVPVTKYLAPIVGGCSSLVVAYNLRPNSQLPVQVQFWRYFISHFGFNSFGSTVAGTYLLYRMKIIEQRYGSSKYAAMLFISFVASALIHTGTGLAGSPIVPNGPITVIFTILYQYQKIVPPNFQSKLLGLAITDKTYVYIPAVQLLLSNPFSSFFSCLCGLALGSVYDNTHINTWRIPTVIRNFSSRYLNHRPKKPKMTKAQRIKEEDIQTMSAMFPDYPRPEIERALQTAKSDLNRATDILLNSGASSSH